MEDNSERQQRYQARQQRLKEKVDARIAAAQDERGLMIVITGDGKGKSTSGFGTVTRAVGHGMNAGVVQFIKGTWECGERVLLQKAGVEFHIMATGFTWETQNKEKDQQAAQLVWQEAKRMLASDSYDVVLLDELTYMVAYHYLDVDDVVTALTNRPLHQHVIITGRGCHRALLEIADTVSEIKNVKHAFDSGIKAQKGIDW
ncbi:cob(I)alamin adenosyltransferase [Tolumonas auensis DSM 9187]|uniref:Corrinoid adenosyltransferase n=1 Tax=Tolumonas auensis (strain DSM 9187 / NBRC 110442 / TA 4) TaxID=595494 RepID=C4L7J0_TOLAT|nr:cob(I)yrinic acid a,c-diamide adenosyltransferase [Tolumonas auensis]ACQ93606.1 cob(I)alamin adenosyltransferase [Tolumonas auensis DSM 9187]